MTFVVDLISKIKINKTAVNNTVKSINFGVPDDVVVN